jgi:glyoxylase-like metal-dependent hydrolase (beta-lactamase superfamily II)
MTILLGEDEWQVLHTPGHTGGLICLYQAGLRLLLSSDHLLRDVSSNPIVEPPAEEGAERPRRLIQYVEQLERIARLPVDLALPGHGPPITDVPGLINDRIAFHEQRAGEVLGVLKKGESTVYEISLILFPDLDPINRFLAISEVIGHLDLLEHRGEVSSQNSNGVVFWKPS